MQTFLYRFARWLVRKTAPASLIPASTSNFMDAYRRLRHPSSADLLGELKNTAWTCATINASVCATFPPKLYVSTAATQAPPRCATRSLEPMLLHSMRASHPRLAKHTVEEVVDHPLLTLFRQVNPVHNRFDLWELTELSLETAGSACRRFARRGIAAPSRPGADRPRRARRRRSSA